ncbi:hypothetical protein LTR84_005745 [Exophiala bonariae]|uniref:Uncharacterized protein n=1 Tax=Exophiala bonariae TaxID=1690606 RepID=A0AAV9N4G0_9EURO|nr:hypothetical protein LTR84_005745 [Exophiala bonariae]
MGKALGSCLKKLLEGEKQFLESQENVGKSESNKSVILEDYYNDYLREKILEKLRNSKGAKNYTTTSNGGDVHEHPNKWMIVDGEIWEFLSNEHKAFALRDAMEELSRGIDEYLDRLMTETNNGTVVRVDRKHHRLRIVTMIKKLLRDHGAKEGQVGQNS